MSEACPCQSGRSYGACCAPFHAGRAAPTPEALMRSRFSAYARGDARYLMRTTDPEGPHHNPDRGAWKAELEAYSAAVTFEALEVVGSGSDGPAGWVHFRATLGQGTRRWVQEERSRFRRKGRRWVYTDGSHPA